MGMNSGIHDRFLGKQGHWDAGHPCLACFDGFGCSETAAVFARPSRSREGVVASGACRRVLVCVCDTVMVGGRTDLA